MAVIKKNHRNQMSSSFKTTETKKLTWSFNGRCLELKNHFKIKKILLNDDAGSIKGSSGLEIKVAQTRHLYGTM